ncbi:MAG: helix-turn-helix transcriptional regulator [Planctomycetes bacterium]|nr:helix-turn-helix transcriptional regulator [Planctomycetota bacterium]
MAKSFEELVERTATRRTRDRAEQRTKELLGELLLSELRQAAGKSQGELARALGIRQPSLSKLEHQEDMQISTLQKIVEALGGELEVIARFPKGSVRIDQFDGQKRSSGKRRNDPQGLQLL